ncbi:MAG: DUF819 family protein [Phycisphaerales bacterium]|nr:MAG: DUF819 family protein [Phycisphaerales bacterium]
MFETLAQADAATREILVEDPVGVLVILLVVLAVVLSAEAHPYWGRVLRIVPALALCYIIPSILSSTGVIPSSGGFPLYVWIKNYVLPASLLLLTLSLDLPAIARLGPKAVIMMLVGTAGVVVGGPIALAVTDPIASLFTENGLPDDAWRGMAALSGSWIGGGANMTAIQHAGFVQTPDSMMGPIIVVDTVVAAVWMACLFFLAGRREAIDRWTGADVRAIDALQQKMSDYQASVMHAPRTWELMVLVALGFGFSWLATLLPARGIVPKLFEIRGSGEYILEGFTWTVVLITSFGVLLSMTPLRKLEGAGASRLGSVFLYVLVASIGAKADLHEILKTPAYVVMGFIWLSIHAAAMLIAGYLIKAPVFFLAVGSQANIGGAASAPVVASAFHSSLAPVGVLLAILGYVLGTYAALVCAYLLKAVAGAS